MMNGKISVLINTLNEESNIRNCLESVKWADEIILVDMYSQDRTVEIAREYTDRIFYFKPMGYADPARQFALEQAKYEWVLVIDADELVPVALRDELYRVMRENAGDVVYVPRMNYYFGRLIQGLGWGPLQDAIPRFFKRGALSFSDEIHTFFRVHSQSAVFRITSPEKGFIHFAYKSPEQLIQKMNRYTTIEAQNMFDGKKQPKSFFKTVVLMMKQFLGMFFIRKGYKDGCLGFQLSALMAFYRLVTYLKYSQMKKYQTKNFEDEIIQQYQKITDQSLKNYQ